jgi:hypothetical protein
MATEADVLRSINAIIQGGERREQYRVQTAIQMMQMSQAKRMQDINIASNKLEVATSWNTQMRPGLASDFLGATGLGSYYQETTTPKKKEGAQTSAVEGLVKDYGFSPVTARSTVQALWSYYEAENPRPMVQLASQIGEVVKNYKATGEMSSGGTKLFQSFVNLQKKTEGVGDIKTIALQSLKNLENEFYISKETGEFLKGEYDIQSDIGVYEDIKEPIEKFLSATDYLETEEGLKLVNQVIEAGEKDEDWDPSPGGALAFIGAIYGGQYLAPAVRAEATKYAEGTRDYLKQLAKDLKHPARGGLPSKEFKKVYDTVKGPVWQRKPETMQRLLKAARSAGWGNTTSISKAQAALEAINKSRFLSRTGKIIGGTAKAGWAAGYFAPMAGRSIGEAVGDELGEAVGGTVGTGVLGAKALSAKMVNKVGDRTKMSFISYLGRKAGMIGGKAAIMAMADSPALPFGDILALGYTAIEVVRTYKQWQQYLDT